MDGDAPRSVPPARRTLVAVVAALVLTLLTHARAVHAESRDTGFYLRLSLGTSVLHHVASVDAHEVVADGGRVQVVDTRLAFTQNPGGFVGEVAVGWSPSPRIALAATYIDHPYPLASYGAVRGSVLGVNARAPSDVTLSVYGLLLVLHPNPSGLWHLGAVAGVAALAWTNPYATTANDARSIGFALGPEVGIDAYAGERFWIGVTARVLVGRTTKEDGNETDTFFVPTLLVTVSSIGVAGAER